MNRMDRGWGGFAVDKLFLVELSGGNIRHCELELPATDYELLDALDKLRLSEADKLYFDICDYYGYNYLTPFISDTLNLYELNALSRKLADLNPAQQTAFAGLLKMEIEKRDGDILIPKLIDLAYSADCCHVVAEALNDAQLGRFYADNGFIPITENVPDSVYELLDFEALGRKARNEEGGVFVDRGTYGCCGYVVRHTDLVEAYKTMDLAPRKPPYTLYFPLITFRMAASL